MSTVLRELNGISITQYGIGNGELAYQVTWETSNTLFGNEGTTWLSFNSLLDAEKFAALLVVGV